METFRQPIQKAIITTISPQIDEETFSEEIALLICEYSGYYEFIGYKFGYVVDSNDFDTRPSACEPFGFVAGQKVWTPEGTAIVIGVAYVPDICVDPNELMLCFDLNKIKNAPFLKTDKDRQREWVRHFYPKWKKQDFIDAGFHLLPGFVNIWGQSFHSFKKGDLTWWEREEYTKQIDTNPFNMPTEPTKFVSRLSLKCICGNSLSKYEDACSIYPHPIKATCDKCKHTGQKNEIFWHCDKGMCPEHIHGYDVCDDCMHGRKQRNVAVKEEKIIIPTVGREDESTWFYSSKWTYSVQDKYSKGISENIEAMDIGRCIIWTAQEQQRIYLIHKASPTHGYQINMETRFCRKIIRGSIFNEEIKQNLPSKPVEDESKTPVTYSWYWEGDEPNKNIWNKYDDDTCQLLNNQSKENYGARIPFQLKTVTWQEHSFNYILIRCSTKEGLQRNHTSGFGRRIVRSDHELIDLEKIISSKEYDKRLKKELLKERTKELLVKKKENKQQEEEEEKYDSEPEKTEKETLPKAVVRLPTTTVSAEVGDVDASPEPTTLKSNGSEYKMTSKKTKQTKINPVIPEGNQTKEDVHKKAKIKGWQWHKCIMYSGYVGSRAMSLLDLITDLILLYKASQNGLQILTITLFISIFSPYVLSYSSGIKLFIFRKTFDHLQGFKKIFLLLYLLPTGFLYFIMIDLIDILFTVYKWFLYNVLFKKEKQIKESEEVLAQQLGMDRMNWEGFKRQKTVGQLMFETIPQVVLQAFIASGFGAALLTPPNGSSSDVEPIEATDLYISICAAAINSIGQFTKLYLESLAVQESFTQYALRCMMGRVGWVPFKHKITKIFTNININTSQKQNNDNVVVAMSKTMRKSVFGGSKQLKLSEMSEESLLNELDGEGDDDHIQVIDFNIKYDIPLISWLSELVGLKRAQGTIEYDFSTVTIRYLIATLLVLHTASSDGKKKKHSIKIKFGTSLRLLGVHDIALLFDTCNKKNILLENVKDIVDWENAFEISVLLARKDPRLVSYSRDESGRPLLIGLYLCGFDPDKTIFRSLLKNDVPLNLEDSSGETIIYHLLRKLDYVGIRELFKTKYEKDEKRSNVYLNIYNRAGYSPLYLALHSHAMELKQMEAEKQDDFVVNSPSTEEQKEKIENKENEEDKDFVYTTTTSIAGEENKIEEEEEEKKEEPKGKKVLFLDLSGNEENRPLMAESPKVENIEIEEKEIEMAPIAPIAPMAPMVESTKTEDEAAIANTKKKLKSPQAIKSKRTEPLTFHEQIKFKPYLKMLGAGEPMAEIVKKMEKDPNCPDDLLERHLYNKNNKKKKKKKQNKKKSKHNDIKNALSAQLKFAQKSRSNPNPLNPSSPKSAPPTTSSSETNLIKFSKKYDSSKKCYITLKGPNNRFLCVEEDGQMTCNRAVARRWEQFDSIPEERNGVALLSHLDKYISAESSVLLATKATVSRHEIFTVTSEKEGRFAFKSYDNRWITTHPNGDIYLSEQKTYNAMFEVAVLTKDAHAKTPSMARMILQNKHIGFNSNATGDNDEPIQLVSSKLHSKVDKITKQLDRLEKRSKKRAKRGALAHRKQKADKMKMKQVFIELAKMEVLFAGETILNGLRFRLRDDLWNSLSVFYEYHSMIEAVYKCIKACEQMLITTKDNMMWIAKYVKMASLGIEKDSIQTQMKDDKKVTKLLSMAFLSAYKLLYDVREEWLVPSNTNDIDITIALRCKSDLERTYGKKYQKNANRIYQSIPLIMNAQNMKQIRKKGVHNKQKDTIKEFLKDTSIDVHYVEEELDVFLQRCDIEELKRKLNDKFIFSELQIPKFSRFAPVTGQYKEYIWGQLRENRSFSQTMVVIQQEESKWNDEYVLKFKTDSYKCQRGFIEKKEERKDSFEDDVSDIEANKEWMYQILLSNSGDPNFECYNGGSSPLAYALTHYFDHIYVANDLVQRGAKLQAKERSIMVNIWVQSAFHDDHDLYLMICDRICRKSDIELSNVLDANGNNPLHLAVLKQDPKWEKNKKKKNEHSINHAFIRKKTNALRVLHAKYSNWSIQKNNRDQYPLSLAVKLRDVDSTMCLGAMCSGQQYWKSIVSQREFVMDLVIWICAVLQESHSSDKWRDANYMKLMLVELLFTVFEYNISLRWPSKYVAMNEIVHFDKFNKQNVDLSPFSLISHCYDKRLYSVLSLLKTEFNVFRFLSDDEKQKVKEMEIEIKEFTGNMFLESKKKFDNRWQERVMDKIKNDMLFENNDQKLDVDEIGKTFRFSDGPMFIDDDMDNNDDLDDDEGQKAVSWIEVIYSTTVEGLSTADFVTDILILRDLWNSGNLWWTTFMLSLLVAPYLVCYSALGGLIEARMNFIYLTMGSEWRFKWKWRAFKGMVLMIMTPLCIFYFVIIDIVFMIYVLFATIIFFLSCTKLNISDAMDDWVFKKIFGLNRMQIIGYRRLRTLSQLFFETIPQIFLQLRILYDVNNPNTETTFEIGQDAILWSIGFATLHMIFEAAIISLDSSASKMKFIHYAIVCLGARLDWIPFSHLFKKKAKEIQQQIDENDYMAQTISIRHEYFESDRDDEKEEHRICFNYEEISSGLLGLRYKLEYQFSNESIKKLAENFTYLPSPTIPTNHTSNVMLKCLMSEVLLGSMMMEIIIGKESSRNVDIFSVAELYRSTVHVVDLNIDQIDFHRILHNSHIGSHKTKYLSLILEEFINYGELRVVELLSQKHLGLNKDAQSIKYHIILNSLGGANGIHIDEGSKYIEGGKFDILRKYYTEGLVFGLDCKLNKIIYAYFAQCLQQAQQENTYFYVAIFILWYTRSSIFHHSCSAGCCRARPQAVSITTKKNKMSEKNMHNLIDEMCGYVPQILEIGQWEMSFKLTECFTVFKVHLEELLLNQLKNSNKNGSNPLKSKKLQKKKVKSPKSKKMLRMATTMNVEKTSSVRLRVSDEYTRNVFELDFDKLSETINQSHIDLLQAIVDTSLNKLRGFPVCTFFMKKIVVLDEFVTSLRMVYEYDKYMIASRLYRESDSCLMGDNGRILDSLHMGSSNNTTKTIVISMKELKQYTRNMTLGMHLGITRMRFKFKDLQIQHSGNDDKKEKEKEKEDGIGHIKLHWINPIEPCDKKISSNNFTKTESIDWNKVYLKNEPFSFKMAANCYFDVEVGRFNLIGLSMYNRRIIDHIDKDIPPLTLELSMNEGYNMHCDGVELEIEFIKKNLRMISVTDETKPIHRLCQSKSVKLLKYLVPTYTKNRSFDINAMQKKTGNTPLHISCSAKKIDKEIVEFLIANGAKINKLNAAKETALDLVQKAKGKNRGNGEINHAVEKLLLENGAKYNKYKPKATTGSNDPRLKEYLNMLKIGVPIWAVIQFMKKKGADRGLINSIERMQVDAERGQN